MQKYIDFSIEKKRFVKKLCSSRATYVGSSSKMNFVFLLLAVLAVCTNSFVAGEYPGGRRRNPYNNPSPNEKEFLIEQLTSFIDQQARRKFQQQIHMHHQKQQFESMPQEITGPGFSFKLPASISTDDFNSAGNEPIDFAVHPFDSRYYEPSSQQLTYDETVDDGKIELADDEATIETSPVNPNILNILKAPIYGTKNKILIPSPMHVNELPASSASSASLQSTSDSQRILHRAQQKQQQLQQQLLNKQPDVLQKPLQVEFDNTTSLYIVALIAGLSCAFSTGLIALGLMYWTLKKKVKSADACDYNCDYGIVGPVKHNVDTQVAIGDKKLAHSAQMFHYQHQKNQIIAMENRNGTEMDHNDDDNDSDENENDFTVYECVGLAEWTDTGGIEVKNPLFSEETPATKTEKTQPPTSKTNSKSQK